MSCFGHKQYSIKIGNKSYPFNFIKAQVETPIIGWDFMKSHKLDLRWNDQDELTIFDKNDQTSSVLHQKPVPFAKSINMKNLSLVTKPGTCPDQAEAVNPEILLGEVAAVKALGTGPLYIRPSRVILNL